MRDPNRIDSYMARLAECWRMVPDWRLGQFLTNVLSMYYDATNGKDAFYPEDEEFMTTIENYMAENI